MATSSVVKHSRIANELKFCKYSNVICKIHLSNNVLENVDTVGGKISNKNFSFAALLVAYTSALFVQTGAQLGEVLSKWRKKIR